MNRNLPGPPDQGHLTGGSSSWRTQQATFKATWPHRLGLLAPWTEGAGTLPHNSYGKDQPMFPPASSLSTAEIVVLVLWLSATETHFTARVPPDAINHFVPNLDETRLSSASELAPSKVRVPLIVWVALAAKVRVSLAPTTLVKSSKVVLPIRA